MIQCETNIIVKGIFCLIFQKFSPTSTNRFYMGLLKGTASFVRFSVLGELPENTLDFIADRVVAFSFQDIDDSYDEYSIGWVSERY